MSLYQLISLTTLLAWATTSSTWIKINENFVASPNFKVEITDVYLIDLYKMKVNFICEFTHKICNQIFKDYYFVATTDRDKKPFKLKIAWGGYCMDDHIPQFQTRTYKHLKIEFPTDKFDDKGHRLNFYRIAKVSYQKFDHPNAPPTASSNVDITAAQLTDDDRQRSLKDQVDDANRLNGLSLDASDKVEISFPKHVREQFLAAHANKLIFQCVEPLKRETLIELSGCEVLRGKVQALSSSMVYFKDVDLTPEAQPKKLLYENDITFKFYGRDRHGKAVEDFAINKHNLILKYEGKPINRAVYLPRSLNLSRVEGVNAINNYQQICHFPIDPEKRSAAEKAVAGNIAIPPKVLMEDAKSQCERPLNLLDGGYNTTDDFMVGSVATYFCDEGYTLSPTGFSLECAVGEHVAEWGSAFSANKVTGLGSSYSPPECILKPLSCQGLSEYCRNGGTCVDANGSVSCSCKKAFYGDLCEKVNNPCDQQPCVHGFCSAKMDYEGFNCVCLKGYAGKLCDQQKNLHTFCGEHGKGYKTVATGVQCLCQQNYTAEVNQICHSKEQPRPKCTLYAIPHGFYKAGINHLFEGEIVAVGCENGFHQSVRSVKCLETGELSTAPRDICKQQEQYTPQTVEQEKTSAGDNLVFWILVFGTALLFGFMFFTLYFWRNEEIKSADSNLEGYMEVDSDTD